VPPGKERGNLSQAACGGDPQFGIRKLRSESREARWGHKNWEPSLETAVPQQLTISCENLTADFEEDV
jgi:hypothetical protein